MNKTNYLLLLLLPFAAASCVKNPENQNFCEPKSFVYAKEANIGPELETPEDGKGYCSTNVQIELVVDNVPNAQLANFEKGLSLFFSLGKETDLQKAIEQEGDSLFNSFSEDLLFIVSDTDNRFNNLLTFYDIKTGEMVAEPHPATFGYEIETEGDMGGAHGYHYVVRASFDRETGVQITYNEAFDMNHEEEIKQLIREAFLEEYEVSSLEVLRDSTGFLSLGDVFLSNTNFVLEKDGVSFHYNQYDIAPYSSGSADVFVPYKKLKGLCKFSDK